MVRRLANTFQRFARPYLLPLWYLFEAFLMARQLLLRPRFVPPAPVAAVNRIPARHLAP